MIDFLEKMNLLKQIPRMGWLEAGVDPGEAEDVAQHTFITAVIALILSDSMEEEVDSGKILKMAVVQDWAEVVTGDFSERAISLLGGRELKNEMEEKALKDLLSEDLPERNFYLEIWREYSRNETREAKLVHVADRLSILVEAARLFERGENSKKLKEIWTDVRDELESYFGDFPVLKRLMEHLDGEYSFPE